MALLQRDQRVPQKVHRNVHRHIAGGLQHGKQSGGFRAAPGAQVQHQRTRRHLQGHVGPMGGKNRRFSARGVVLRQFGDGTEQA